MTSLLDIAFAFDHLRAHTRRDSAGELSKLAGSDCENLKGIGSTLVGHATVGSKLDANAAPACHIWCWCDGEREPLSAPGDLDHHLLVRTPPASYTPVWNHVQGTRFR